MARRAAPSSTASRSTARSASAAPREGKLEVLGIESADPRWVVQSADALAETAHRLRAIGAIAVSLCQVAAARFDAMASLKRCRAVDAAAAQLIVREAGGQVAFIAYDDPLAAPLDLEPRSPVIAARTPDGLAAVADRAGLALAVLADRCHPGPGDRLEARRDRGPRRREHAARRQPGAVRAADRARR